MHARDLLKVPNMSDFLENFESFAFRYFNINYNNEPEQMWEYQWACCRQWIMWYVLVEKNMWVQSKQLPSTGAKAMEL